MSARRGRFLDELQVRWDGSHVHLLARFRYEDSRLRIWCAPEGFDSDLSSFPIDRIGTAEAGVIHDLAYRHAGEWLELERKDGDPDHVYVSRALADALYRDAMLADGYPWWRAWERWLGLRLLGGPTWRRYLAANRQAGRVPPADVDLLISASVGLTILGLCFLFVWHDTCALEYVSAGEHVEERAP